jgi:hypothetical protein
MISKFQIRSLTFLDSWVPGALMTLFIILSLSGCHTTSPIQGRKETREDVKDALSAVAGALGGKPLDEKALRNLEKQVRTDEDAQTAIRAITESVGGKTPAVKYCPVTGRRYAPHLEICPEHGVELKTLDSSGKE